MARRKAEATAHQPEASTPEPTANDTDDEAEELAVPPFFNTTFSTHRISPLYVGAQRLSQGRLDTLARRLRDMLVGDVVRGIQVGLEAAETPLGRQVGPLRAVQMRWFRAEDVLGRGGEGGEVEDIAGLSNEQKQGLWIEIRHENASYVALLLPAYSKTKPKTTTTTGTKKGAGAPRWAMRSGNGSGKGQGDEADGSHFVDLPLLLMKMPVALKTMVSEWLASTFDCRVSRLSLGTRTLVRVWEGWMQAQHAGLPRQSADLVVTLAFNAPLAPRDITAGVGEGKREEEGGDYYEEEAGLKSMEISVASTELRHFLRAGESILKDRAGGKDGADAQPSRWDTVGERERRRLAGPNTDDGWAWRKSKDGPGDPFTEALARYLDHHLALDLFHPGVRVVQVACGGFVLAQSRVKIARPGPGVATTEESAMVAWMFVMQLGERIRGGGGKPPGT
ncbi:hypothetical protein ESCO_002087 [Escovopsis weberi]|uniref:Siroheme synthase n=1 Tax=Escovopsis weberi TaxID=150374 RepID=A0A0M8N7T4_ESCWE|nr:hypothetical protein ESCO_002087 [Escovopsis weberi]